MALKKGGVGFFDSGIGGLTVLKSCVEISGERLFYYYGDNAHAPYGNKSKEELRPFVYRAFDCFQALSVRAAVIACNTVTAMFIDELRQKYPFPIVGAEPAVLPAVRFGGSTYALMTRNTFESERFRQIYMRALHAYPNAKLQAFPCDGLAGAIERGARGEPFDPSDYLPSGSPDAVALGCTHYVFVKPYVESFYGCKAFDGNGAIARRLQSVLGENVYDFGTADPTDVSFRFFCPFLSPRCGKERKHRWRRSEQKGEKCFHVKRAYALRFLGMSANGNRLFYKRMFAFLSKMSKMGKNPKKT